MAAACQCLSWRTENGPVRRKSFREIQAVNWIPVPQDWPCSSNISSCSLIQIDGVGAMKLKVLMVVACIAALVAMALYSFVESDAARNVIAGASGALWIAIALGIVIRLIRTKRGNKIRAAFSPVVGAADIYQSLLLGRPTTIESREASNEHINTDKFTSGP